MSTTRYPALRPASALTSLLSAGLCAAALGQEPTTHRVSVDSAGAQSNAGSGVIDMSSCGRFVAFQSSADNLVEGDTNGNPDVFVHDKLTGETTLVSISTDGEQGNSASWDCSISAHGRFVVFESGADNLVEGDTNGSDDIFMHDRNLGLTTLISVNSSGVQGDSYSWDPKISGNGQFVVFGSGATNLVDGDTNDEQDIFVHDRSTDLTTRVSVSSFGGQADESSREATISDDGRIVGFESQASNLVALDTNDETDVFVHDRQTGETIRVSVSSDGEQGFERCDQPSISGDGRFVIFWSRSSNLVAGDTNDESDIFVHDLQTGETTRVSVSSDGTEANARSLDPSITDDGRYLTFSCEGSNLVDVAVGDFFNSYLHDRETGETVLIGVGMDGVAPNALTDDGVISGDGSFVAFESYGTNLVEGDTNDEGDVFTRGPLIGEPRLARLATFDLFAGGDLDVVLSDVNGTMAAGKQVWLDGFSSAHDGDLHADSEVITAGTKLRGQNGAVMRGNAVYGTKDKLKDSVSFLDASSGTHQGPPCLAFDLHLLHEAAMDLSTSLGMTPATGTTLDEFENLYLDGTEPGLNVFLVTREQIQGTKSVKLNVPHGSRSVINVEGGKVNASVCGIELLGASPEDVLFNFFEADKVGLSLINLEAGVLSPFAKLTVEGISVYGGLIAKRLKVRNVYTSGQLFDLGSLVDLDEDEFLSGEDGSDTPGYTLTWTPDSEDQLVKLVYYSPEVMEIWVDGPKGTVTNAVRQIRLDRLERLVFTDRSDLSRIQIDPEINLPVELTGLAPVAQDDHVALKWGGSGTADVLANDLAGPAALDPTSVQVLSAAQFGTVTVDPATGAVTYDCMPGLHKPAGVQGEVLEYTVRDANGNQSTPRRVRFSFDNGDLSQR